MAVTFEAINHTARSRPCVNCGEYGVLLSTGYQKCDADGSNMKTVNYGVPLPHCPRCHHTYTREDRDQIGAELHAQKNRKSA